MGTLDGSDSLIEPCWLSLCSLGLTSDTTWPPVSEGLVFPRLEPVAMVVGASREGPTLTDNGATSVSSIPSESLDFFDEPCVAKGLNFFCGWGAAEGLHFSGELGSVEGLGFFGGSGAVGVLDSGLSPTSGTNGSHEPGVAREPLLKGFTTPEMVTRLEALEES